MSPSFEKDFSKSPKHILSADSDVSFTARSKEWERVTSDGPRSHRSILNGGAIKAITLQTIKKKKDMKVLSNYDSYLIFNLEQLFHRHLFVLGDPSGSVNASEAAAAAVLVEEDVVELDLHEGVRRATASHIGSRHQLAFRGRKERRGGESGSGSHRETKRVWKTLAQGEGTPHHMTQTHLLRRWLRVSERRLCSGPVLP